MALSDFTNSIITKDQFSGTFNKFDRAVTSSGQRLDKLGGIMSGGGLGILFGGMAGVAGAVAIGKMAFALGDLGAQAITTEASFYSLIGSVGATDGLLRRLKDAAGGTMTEMALMQQANTALAGSTGALSQEMADALPKLLEAGRAAAKLNPSYGDAAFMFQSLVTGVKRGSPMLIDNTGITLKLGEATEEYAASIGKSVSELTSQERSIAILRATLEGADTLINQAGTGMENMAAQSKILKVAMEELKTAVGVALAPTTSSIQGNAANVMQTLTASLNNDELALARLELERVDDAYQGAVRAQDGWFNGLLKAIYGEEAQRDALVAMAQEVAKAQAEVKRLELIELGYINASEGARFATGNFATSATLAAANVGQLTFSLRQAKEAAAGLGGSLAGLPKEYTAGLNSAFGQVYGMGSAIPAGEADAIYSQYTRQYAQLELDRSNLSRQEYARRKADLDASLSEQLSSYRSHATSVSGIATDLSSDLKSKIGSALQPSFDLSGLTGGLLGGNGGDAFDEAYKRLAAVALRPEELQIHSGDWAATFEQAGLTGLTPEQAQARARELVEAYSRGLDFSLIDREKIKDQVRQAIKAEELYNSIVDEIYAEMGKERQGLTNAGQRMGSQINRGMIVEAKSGAKDVAYAYLDVMEPELIRRLAENKRRGGGAYQ